MVQLLFKCPSNPCPSSWTLQEGDPNSGKQVSGIVFPYQCTAASVSYCLCRGGSAGLLGPTLLTELQL